MDERLLILDVSLLMHCFVTFVECWESLKAVCSNTNHITLYRSPAPGLLVNERFHAVKSTGRLRVELWLEDGFCPSTSWNMILLIVLFFSASFSSAFPLLFGLSCCGDGMGDHASCLCLANDHIWWSLWSIKLDRRLFPDETQQLDRRVRLDPNMLS